MKLTHERQKQKFDLRVSIAIGPTFSYKTDIDEFGHKTIIEIDNRWKLSIDPKGTFTTGPSQQVRKGFYLN